MKASATQIRILILVVNIGLGIGIPSYAAYRYLGTPEPKASNVPIVELKKLEFNASATIARGDTQAQDRLRSAAERLQPQPPPPPPPPPPIPDGEPKPPDATPDAAKLDPGKLAEDGWYYAEFLIRHEDRKNSLVILRKRDPSAQPGALPVLGNQGSNRTNVRAKPAPRQVRMNVRPGVKPGPQQPSDQVSFLVKKGRFTNEELGLDFFIDSADENQFVYWLPDKWQAGKGPTTMYALKYVPESRYSNSDPNERVLSAPPKTPEEIAAEGEKKAGIILRPSASFEFDTKAEYDDLKSGKLSPSAGEKESKGGLVPALKKDGDVAPADGTFAPGQKPPMPNLGGALQPKKWVVQPAAGPRPATAEDIKQLKDGIKGIPKDAQKQVLDAMKGIKPGK